MILIDSNDIPTLIWGESNRFCIKRNFQEIRHLSSRFFKIYPESGHWHPYPKHGILRRYNLPQIVVDTCHHAHETSFERSDLALQICRLASENIRTQLYWPKSSQKAEIAPI